MTYPRYRVETNQGVHTVLDHKGLVIIKIRCWAPAETTCPCLPDADKLALKMNEWISGLKREKALNQEQSSQDEEVRDLWKGTEG